MLPINLKLAAAMFLSASLRVLISNKSEQVREQICTSILTITKPTLKTNKREM